MKKAIVVVLLACMICSGAFATLTPNYQDTSWSMYLQSMLGYTNWRAKANTSKVYVHPSYVSGLYMTVMGGVSSNAFINNTPNESNLIPPTTETTRSKTFWIGAGIQASITNYVVENSENCARIKFNNYNTSSYGYATGVWSPDSTMNYTIYS